MQEKFISMTTVLHNFLQKKRKVVSDITGNQEIRFYLLNLYWKFSWFEFLPLCFHDGSSEVGHRPSSSSTLGQNLSTPGVLLAGTKPVDLYFWVLLTVREEQMVSWISCPSSFYFSLTYMSMSGTTWSVRGVTSSRSSSCTTQGWSRTSSELILSLGSRRIRFLIKHLALFDTVSGILKFPRLIFLNKFVWSKSLNGYLKGEKHARYINWEKRSRVYKRLNLLFFETRVCATCPETLAQSNWFKFNICACPQWQHHKLSKTKSRNERDGTANPECERGNDGSHP